MKRFFLLLAVCMMAFAASSQNISTYSLTGTNIDTVLKKYVEGDGVEITAGRLNGNTGNVSTSTLGRFVKNAGPFPFEKGIYMITNGATYSDASNTFTQKNLSNIVSNITNGTALDFKFVAYADTFAFNYIFASSEYTSYTCSNYNDVFAFFLEGFDPVTFVNTTKNVAVIPSTITASNPNGIPVTINSVNSGQCSGSYSSSTPGVYLQYSNFFTTSYNSSYPSSLGSFNGSTVSLAAESRIMSCQTYKMHLAVSNVSDQALDSGVFIEEGSFYSPNVEITGDYGENDMAEGDTLIQNCRECDLKFELPTAPLSGNISVSVQVGGNAFLGQDFSLTLPNGTMFSPANNGFVFAQGETTQELHMKILPTAQFAPNQVKNVIVYFQTERCPGNDKSVSYDTLMFYLRGNDSIKLKQGLTFGACDTLKHMEMELLSGTPYKYQWFPETGIQNPNALSPETFITQSGTYKLVASDQWNCMTDTAEVEVTIVPKPEFTINYSPDHGCMPLDVTLQTQYTPDFATLHWTVDGDYGYSEESADPMVHLSLPDSGYYNVKLVVESAPGCADSTLLTHAVHVSGFPEADFTFSPAEPGNGEEITFTNTSTGGNISSYVWNFGDGHSSFLENPTHAYHLQESDIKTVVLTVTNTDGCTDDVVYTIPVEDNFAIFIPSGFSPNTDGVNEVFLPSTKDVANYRLEIYSRNGEMIFFSTDPMEGWDGTFKGKPVPQGVYIYKVYFARIGTPDQMMMRTGSVTVVR